MLRIIWAAIVAFVVTLLFAPLVTIVALVHSHARIIDVMIRAWARAIVRAAGVRLAVERPEVIDPDAKYIFIGNHHSYLDIPCLLLAIPQQVRFMAKASLFKIPIFGWGLIAAGFIPIDRKDRSKAVKSFDLAGQRIRKGNSIVVFPEEGRSREREMLPFKRGAFLLAIRTQLPIAPMALIGTYDVLPARRLSIRPGPVVIRFLDPVDTAGLSLKAKEELMEETQKRIAGQLQQYYEGTQTEESY
ncbi:MAG: lysophospholipid acyltransferase family protein [Thermoanaerobaculia bacterium]